MARARERANGSEEEQEGDDEWRCREDQRNGTRHDRATLGINPQVLARHHAQGQGAQRRPRSHPHVDLGDVPQVPRRHGVDTRGGSEARRQEVQARARVAVPLAGLGREGRRHHWRRVDRVHQSGGVPPSRRLEGRRTLCVPALAARSRGWRPARRHRDRV